MSAAIGYYGGIVTDGLVLYMDAAKKDSYPGFGNSWRSVARGVVVTGSLINGPTFSVDGGGSIQFDGTNDYLEVLRSESGSNAGSYTFGGWFRAYQGGPVYVRGRDGFGSGWSTSVSYDIVTNKIVAAAVTTVPGTATIVTAGSIKTVPTNTWVHAYAVWNAGVSLLCYVNGDLDSSFSTTRTVLRSSTVGWSASIIRSDLIYKSDIAAYSVYNRVLSATEILQNYNATRGRFGL